MKVNEGICPKLYGGMANMRQRMTIVEDEKYFMAPGHLLVDKMKLKSDIYWKVALDEVVGFASDNKSLDLAAEVKAMLKDTGNETDATDKIANTCTRPTKKPAAYVNQWRFHPFHL
jgi:hypothetical protein